MSGPGVRFRASVAARNISRVGNSGIYITLEGCLLQNQHRIAEAVKAVVLLNCFLICSEHEVAPREGGHQHQQSRPRQVEVSHHRINDAEFVPRVYKEVRPTLSLFKHCRPILWRDLLLSGRRLKHSDAGSTDRNYAPACFLCPVDRLGCAFGKVIPFPVHRVLLDIFLVDRPERIEANVQGHSHKLDTIRTEIAYQFLGKMQSRGGGRSRAFSSRIYGLVAFLVAEGLMDIGRQRHLAQLVQQWSWWGGKTQQPAPKLCSP